MGALSAKGPDDPSLKSLIRNAEDAEMATNLCRCLVSALEHYSEPSAHPGSLSHHGQHHELIQNPVDAHVSQRDADPRMSAERHVNEVSRLRHEARQLWAGHEEEEERLHAQELGLREDHGRRVRRQQRNERARREECERAQRDGLFGGGFEREFHDRY